MSVASVPGFGPVPLLMIARLTSTVGFVLHLYDAERRLAPRKMNAGDVTQSSDWSLRGLLIQVSLVGLLGLTACAGSRATGDVDICWKIAEGSSYEAMMEYLRDTNDVYKFTEEEMSFLVRSVLKNQDRGMNYTTCMMDRGWKCIGDPAWGELTGMDVRELAESVDGWTDAQPFQCRNSDGVVVDIPTP